MEECQPSSEFTHIIVDSASGSSNASGTAAEMMDGTTEGEEAVDDCNGNVASAVPVAIVVSEAGGMEQSDDSGLLEGGSSENHIISLQDAQSATQYFVEHVSGAQALQAANVQTIQVDVDPSMLNGMNGSVLFHVSEDGTREVEMPLGEQQQLDAKALLGGTQSFPPGMYIEVHKEADDTMPNADSDATSLVEPVTTSDATTAIISSGNEVEGETLDLLSGNSRLEDFMDVVTTYRCKFCRFSCAWKAGLMSHFRSCHINASQKGDDLVAAANAEEEPNLAIVKCEEPSPESKSNNVPLLSQRNTTISEEDEADGSMKDFKEQQRDEAKPLEMPAVNIPGASPNETTQEKHIFICGQCNQGFMSLDDCKDHMINDHDLRIDNLVVPKKGIPDKKRGRPRRAAVPQTSMPDSPLQEEDCNDDLDDELDDLDDNSKLGDMDTNELLGKRRIKPPKSLEEYYDITTRKKRAKRDLTTDRTFRCNERSCGYRFKSEENLQYHARCHTNGVKPFTCIECFEKSSHWRGLMMHLWKQHGIDLDLHTCSDCGYKTYSLFKLENHKRIHSEKRDFICAQCGKAFKQLSQLRNHHVIHLDRRNMPEKRWYSEQECDICHRTFSDSKCLRKHQQAVHKKIKPYVCNFCGHMSARKAMLQLHMRQHTGEKPFTCEQCEYRTGDHNSLRRHKMRHTGIKPYKCPHCPYACIQAISYKTHMKNKHPGLEGLFACNLCNFRSVSKENYINHMSDHKRGVLPVSLNTVLTDNNSGGSGNGEGQAPAQFHVPEGTLQQLEGILPGNMTAAQLIYSCLNALNQEGGVTNLPPGVTTAASGDGLQTITIQLPAQATQEVKDQEQFFLTIQQQDDGSMTYLAPSGIEIDDGDGVGSKVAVLHPIEVEEGSAEGLINASFDGTEQGTSENMTVSVEVNEDN